MKKKLSTLFVSLSLILGSLTFANLVTKYTPTFATYSNGDAATYYNSIDSTQSGNTLLTALRTLNLSKRQSTVGYSSMGTTPSGQYKYTDYDPDTVQYDSNGQPYGTKISSFYTYTSATSWNREHVWPNSHGGGSKGDAGSPYPDADIHMPRPTISSENSSRGNSFFVEGMNDGSEGWDPYTAGYSAESRGEAARITFYCCLVNSKLILAPNNTTPSGTDSVTGQSYGSGHTMGNLETLLKWNINYPVTQREKNRNEGAEYLQGNRNAFVDHPEYACKIWGNVNSTTKSLCANASWDVGPSISISKSTASIIVDGTTTINATASDNSNITWSSSDTTIVTVSSASSTSGTNITLTGVGPGTATITARATINSTVYSATCTVTVSSSGSGGGEQSGDGATIAVSDVPSTYSITSFTAGDYSYGCSNIGNSYSTGNIQWRSGQGYLYNTTPIANISSITIAAPTTGSFSGTIYVGSSSHPTSGTSYSITGGQTVNISGSPSYFTIQVGTVSGGAKSGGITIATTSSSQKTLSSISVATAPTKTTYTAGEYFDPTGLVITRTYSDSTSDTYTYANHTSDFTFNPTTSTSLTTSNVSVTITYGGKSCSQSITVNAAKTLSSISVSTSPTKTSYTSGENFDPAGLVIRRNYSDSTYDTYTYANHTSEFTFNPTTSTALTTSHTTVTITFGGKSTTQVITVTAAVKTLSSIEISTAPTKTTYTAGEYFDPTGLVITRTYSDSTSDTYTYANHASEFSFNPSTSTALTTSNVSVTITYGGKSCSQPITVNASGGGSSSDSQRISASTTSTYYESGDICPTGSTSSATATCDAFDVAWNKNSGNNIAYNFPEIRIYGSHSFTITPKSGYTITTVVITANNSNYANAVGGSSLINCTKDVSNVTVTLTPNDGESAVGFTNSAQSRLNYIVVNYEGGSGGSQQETPTSITATVSKSYYVGQTISKSDITVKDNNNNTISQSDFDFANDGYQFTYSDAASGGAATNKTFTNSISYNTLSCSLTVSVSRKARSLEPESVNITYTDLPTTYQTSTDERTAASGIKFIAYNLANYSSKMQFKASGGYLQTTQSLDLISVTINNRETNALTVYGSTNGSTFSQAITGTNDVYDLSGYSYFKIMKNGSGAAYCASITVNYGSAETAVSLSNYIMYEDTANQCTTKLNTAIGYLHDMSSSERTTFQTSNDYVISTARERLEAWAKNQGKTIDYTNGALSNSINLIGVSINENSEFITIVTILSITSICSLAVFLCFRNKHKKQ